MSSLFNGPISVAYHVVLALTQFLSPLPGGLAVAAAIVVFTIGVRLLLSPLSYYAFRGQAGMAALSAKAQDLRQRYGSQPARLQQELAALYRQEGSGMLAGCLPLLLQLPFFSIMYRLFLSGTVDGHRNTLLTARLLSTPLGSHWLGGAGPLSGQGLLFAGLFALLALVGYLTARMTRAATPALVAPAAVAPARTGTRTSKPAAAAQPAGYALLMRLMPYTTVVIAAFVPLAAGIYLLTTTSWTAAERAILRRRLSYATAPPAPATTPPRRVPQRPAA
ncbi:MAG TPA: membrane protein insertase YidC [Streptosporangiaceae bacterium]